MEDVRPVPRSSVQHVRRQNAGPDASNIVCVPGEDDGLVTESRGRRFGHDDVFEDSQYLSTPGAREEYLHVRGPTVES